MYAPIGWHLCRTGRITPQLSVGNTRPVVSLSNRSTRPVKLLTQCLIVSCRSSCYWKPALVSFLKDQKMVIFFVKIFRFVSGIKISAFVNCYLSIAILIKVSRCVSLSKKEISIIYIYTYVVNGLKSHRKADIYLKFKSFNPISWGFIAS